MYSQLQKKPDTIKKLSQIRQKKNLNTISIPTQAVVQRKLNTLNKDRNMEVYEGENIDSEDIGKINQEYYEETQVVEEAKGTIYYGSIQNNELEGKNAIILGLKTRDLGFYYYNKENEKSAEIAFSNKMALRGYINSEVAPNLFKHLTHDNSGISEVKGKKGDGLTTMNMNKKSWYCPSDFKEKKFKDLKEEEQTQIIQKWNESLGQINIETLAAEESLNEYKSILTKEKKNLEKTVSSLQYLMTHMAPPRDPSEDSSKDESTGIHTAPVPRNVEDGHISKFIQQKEGITKDGRYWAAKSKKSLVKRLAKNVLFDEGELESVNVYENEKEQPIGKRDVVKLKGKVIEDKGEHQYRWNANSIEELGDQYAKVDEPRSHREWLEIEKLWNKTLRLHDVLEYWDKTSNLYLDTTGIAEKRIFKNKLIEADINILKGIKIFDYLLQKMSICAIEEKYQWNINTINELGRIFSGFSQATDENWKTLLKVWNNTHQLKISYDLTKKFNTWNQAPTEWGMNSTSNVGSVEETPYAGWSQFSWTEEKSLIKFDTIRPQEVPHYHPGQEEIYTVQEGSAYLLEADKIVRVKKGDTKVIHRNTTHFVVAIDAPYKHTVVQYPSGFHWESNKKEVGDGNKYYEETKKQYPEPEQS